MKLSECSCFRCQMACRRNPGWFLPEEARAAIQAGHAPLMMRDWLEPSVELGNDGRIYVLAPASDGYEGQDAPEFPFMSLIEAILAPPFIKGRCVMFGRDGKCRLHDSGFKPFQCRSSLLCDPDQDTSCTAPDSNWEMARQWNTPLGRAVIEEWRIANVS